LIIPVLHRIVVKQDKIEDKDQAFAAARAIGIEIAFGERKREQQAVDSGVVVAIGPTAFKDFGLDNAPISVGDTIVYARYAGKPVEDPQSKVEYMLLNDEDVICRTTTE
jgi:co-chaperonin GroES (HSP10)